MRLIVHILSSGSDFCHGLQQQLMFAWTTIFTTKLETRDLNTSSTPYEDTIKSNFMSHKRTEDCD